MIPVLPAGEKAGGSFRGAPGAGYHRHRLVWELVLSSPDPLDSRRLLIDAHRGELLMDRPLRSWSDATVTGAVAPRTGGGPAVTVPLPAAAVDHRDGRVTDHHGVYPYEGGPASVHLDGVAVDVRDGCGTIAVASSTDGHVDLGDGNGGCDPGTPSDGNTLAARTAFYYLTRSRLEAAGYLPSISWLQTPLIARTDLGVSSCNNCTAFWEPSSGSVSFAAAGAGCAATGELPAIVVHEHAHCLDHHDGGPAPEGASGEALADTFCPRFPGCRLP